MKKLYALILIFNFSIFNLMAQDFINTAVFGSSGAEFIHGYSVDNAGDLIIGGTFERTVDFNMAQGEESLLTAVSKYDMYIAKHDMSGNYKWAIHLNGNPSQWYYLYSLTTDQSGNIYITGFTDSWIDLDPSDEEAIANEQEDRVFFIAKYNPSGEYQWGHTIGNNETNGSIIGWDIAVDNGSEYLYVSGVFNGTTDFDPSENTFNLEPSRYGNFFLAKYSINGAFIWAKMMTHSNEFGYGRPSRLQMDQDNNVYMGGSITGTFDMDPSDESYVIVSQGEFNQDGFISKYDQNGNFLWAFAIGSATEDYITNLKYKNNKIYTVGAYSDTVDFDPSNNTFELISIPNETSGFMSVYDSEGHFQSAIGLQGKMFEFNGSGGIINDIDLDSENNIYLIGSFFGTFDFDPSDQVVELASTGGISDYDMFLAKYDQNNNYIWAINAGGQSQEQGYHVRANGNENVIAFGYYDGYCDFDPSDQDHWVHNNGGHDVFLAWYSQFSGSFITNAQNAIETHISPNPFTKITKIKYELKQAGTVQFIVYNQLGQLVYQQSLLQVQGPQQLIWNAKEQPQGLYYFRIEAHDQVADGKLVKVR